MAVHGEIPPIARKDDADPFPLCQMNERRVGQLSAELPLAFQYGVNADQIGFVER